jgi:hypothetical protein
MLFYKISKMGVGNMFTALYASSSASATSRRPMEKQTNWTGCRCKQAHLIPAARVWERRETVRAHVNHTTRPRQFLRICPLSLFLRLIAELE